MTEPKPRGHGMVVVWGSFPTCPRDNHDSADDRCPAVAPLWGILWRFWPALLIIVGTNLLMPPATSSR